MDWLSVNTEPLLRKRLLLWTHNPSRPGAAAPREKRKPAQERMTGPDSCSLAEPERTNQGLKSPPESAQTNNATVSRVNTLASTQSRRTVRPASDYARSIKSLRETSYRRGHESPSRISYLRLLVTRAQQRPQSVNAYSA
jgi:hypothetical protein